MRKYYLLLGRFQHEHGRDEAQRYVLLWQAGNPIQLASLDNVVAALVILNVRQEHKRQIDTGITGVIPCADENSYINSGSGDLSGRQICTPSQNDAQCFVHNRGGFIQHHRQEDVTERLNEVYAKEDSSLDPVLDKPQALSLPKGETKGFGLFSNYEEGRARQIPRTRTSRAADLQPLAP